MRPFISGCYDKLILFVVSSGRPLPGSTIRKFSLGSYFSIFRDEFKERRL